MAGSRPGAGVAAERDPRTRGDEPVAEPSASSRTHRADRSGGLWTAPRAGRYPYGMSTLRALHENSRPRRRLRRLAASWCLAAVFAAPAPAVAAYSGVWQTAADESVIGRTAVYISRYEDTLLDIARRFRMGLEELRLVNPDVDIWLPGEGTPVRLPSRFILPDAPRSGVVINLPEMRIYYYPRGESVVHTWPISVGRVGWETPLGKTTIVRKKVRPTWYPPESIREEHAQYGDILPKVVGPGPDNPLGSHALYLGFPAYLIHGTNKPYSIGMRVSHGCIRMYPEHIVELFELVEPGVSVTVLQQGVKAGWSGNTLYLEVHPTTGVPEEEARPSMSDVISSLVAAIPVQDVPTALDWKMVEEALATANGVPVAVASRPPAPSAGSGGSVD